jgi:hypothetical protein
VSTIASTQLVVEAALHEKRGCARVERLRVVAVVRQAADGDNTKLRLLREQLLRQLEAAHLEHRQVDEGNVGARRARELECSKRALRRGDDLDAASPARSARSASRKIASSSTSRMRTGIPRRDVPESEADVFASGRSCGRSSS